jgi:hypothetical protein
MEAIEKGEYVIQKPETTEDYHRIPVPGEGSDKHKDHRIRTIDIDKGKGIKALYCGDCKKVITYLFDTDKWSMADAKRWVEEHKATSIWFGLLMEEEETEKELQAMKDFMTDYIEEIEERLASLEARLADLDFSQSISEGDKTEQTGVESGVDKEELVRTLVAKAKAILDKKSMGASDSEILQAFEDAAKKMRRH